MPSATVCLRFLRQKRRKMADFDVPEMPPLPEEDRLRPDWWRAYSGDEDKADAGKKQAKPNGYAKPLDENWPDPLGEAAYHGLAGDVVRAFAPHSESDPVSLLLQFLAAFGNAGGRGSYLLMEVERHPP